MLDDVYKGEENWGNAKMGMRATEPQRRTLSIQSVPFKASPRAINSQITISILRIRSFVQ